LGAAEFTFAATQSPVVYTHTHASAFTPDRLPLMNSNPPAQQ